jgi:hypothetical protein
VATDFPADPANATVPSPENSRIEVAGGVLSGRPYLIDANAMTHRLDAAGHYTVNGVSAQFADPTATVVSLLVRQGMVYATISTGQTQQANPGMGMAMYNVGLPPAWTTPTGTPAPTTLPPLPTPAAIAPGSSGKIINCGSGQAIETLSAAIPTALAGDTILVSPGNYTDTPPAWTVPLLIDLGGATYDATGHTDTLAHGKALLCPAADSIIQNGTITGVAMDQPSGQLTSAIRPDDGCGYLTIKEVVAHGNQCGVGHGGFPIVIAISDSDISGNGLKANSGSLTHNLYVGAECVSLTLTNVVSTSPNEAHAIKYRGNKMIVTGGTYAAENGSCFDRPNGSTVQDTITGATLAKTANAGDHKLIGYGEEGPTQGLAGMMINGGSIAALCQNPTFNGVPGATIACTGVAFSGNKIVAAGGVVVTGV